MRRNIYIDLGAGDGDTVLQFRNWKHLLSYNAETDYENWTIYGFEPNPRLKEQWLRHTKDDTIIEQKAAWVSDGIITLSIGEPWYKSSVMKEKQDYQEGVPVEVPCFDFSAWIKQFKGDNVIFKSDCEGAEMPILTKMIKDGTDNIPMITFVEWHDGKMPTYDSNKWWILQNYRGNIIEWR